MKKMTNTRQIAPTSPIANIIFPLLYSPKSKKPFNKNATDKAKKPHNNFEDLIDEKLVYNLFFTTKKIKKPTKIKPNINEEIS